MIWLVDYLRRVFCRHKWTYEEAFAQRTHGEFVEKEGLRVSATCTECGHHRSYWKFK